MKRYARLWVGCVVVAACAGAAAETMTWILQDLPPRSMPIDGKPGRGIVDEAVRVVMENWPEAEHRFVVANVARSWLIITEKGNACIAGGLRTPERESIAYFSAFAALPPLQVITRRDAVSKLPLNADGEVKLAELLARPDIKGLLVEQRSYGRDLDPIIVARPKNSGATMVSPMDLGRNIPLMLVANRADYGIEYDFVMAYQHYTTRSEMDSLKSLPIAGVNNLLPTHFVCPRTPWGQRAILKIDQILSRTSDTNAIQATVEKWLSPETLKKYKKDLNAFTLQRKKPSDPAQFQ